MRAALLHRSLVGSCLVTAGVALSACGSSKPPLILNTEKVERAIEKSSKAQRDIRVDVSCPAGVHQRKGLKFVCTAVFKGGRARFEVTQLDDAGRVHYEAR